MKKNQSQRLYIDTDILLYRTGFMTQRRIYTITEEGATRPLLVTTKKVEVNAWLKERQGRTPNRKYELHTGPLEVDPPFQAIFTLKASVNSICQEVGIWDTVLCLTGDTNFRDDVATIQGYKSNRDDKPKPETYDALKRYVMGRHDCVVSDGEEADDVMSIALMQGHVIATLDKDLNNTPGTHYNFAAKKMYYVNEPSALHNFYAQMLIGDTADNIPGIKGMGPKKTLTALYGATTPLEYEERIFPFYIVQYGQKAYEAMEEVGRLLWMRREVGEVWKLSCEEDTTVPWDEDGEQFIYSGAHGG